MKPERLHAFTKFRMSFTQDYFFQAPVTRQPATDINQISSRPTTTCIQVEGSGPTPDGGLYHQYAQLDACIYRWKPTRGPFAGDRQTRHHWLCPYPSHLGFTWDFTAGHSQNVAAMVRPWLPLALVQVMVVMVGQPLPRLYIL